MQKRAIWGSTLSKGGLGRDFPLGHQTVATASRHSVTVICMRLRKAESFWDGASPDACTVTRYVTRSVNGRV